MSKQDDRIASLEVAVATLQRGVATMIAELRTQGLTHLPKDIKRTKVIRMDRSARVKQLQAQAEHMRKIREQKAAKKSGKKSKKKGSKA